MQASGLLIAAISLAVFGAGAHAQTAQITPPVSSPAAVVAAVNAHVDEVSLDLTAHDKRNKPVLDLKAGDLAISDNDTPVTLNSLRLVTGESAAGHLITLVFDPMQGPSAKNAQEIADKIIRMAPRKGFSIAVLMVGARLRLIQPFTDDRKAAEQAVEVATQQGEVQQGIVIAGAEKRLIATAQTGVDASGAHVGVGERALAQALLAAVQGSQLIVQDQDARPALAGLLALARAQQKMDLRKSVVYFTLNGQMDSSAKEMVRTIAGAANRSGVSMYTVDMNGVGAGVHNQLMAMMAMGPLAGQNPIPTPGQGQAGDPAGAGTGTFIANDSSRFEGAGVENANSNPLGSLAANTGGAYIDGQDSVKKPLERMLEDMTTYYEATYTPPIQEYDGKFRSIQVKVLRTGLRIRSRTGYLALPPGGGEGIRPFEAPLLKILTGSPLPADLQFRAAILQMGELPDGNANSVVVETPMSQLEVKEDPNTELYSAHLSVVAQIKDTNGTVIEHFGEDIAPHGSLAEVDKAKAEALTLQRHFIAPPGSYTLEVAVLDRNSEKAAAQRIPFEIAQPKPGPTFSDMVLVRRMDAFRAAADPLEPLRYEDAKVTPNLSGGVQSGLKSVSLFFIVHPDPESGAPAKLEAEVLRNGKPAGHMPLPMRAGTGRAAVPYLATLKTSSMTPGAYEVKATLTQGERTAEHSISFTVVGSPAAGGAVAAEAQPAAPGSDALPSGDLVISIPSSPIPPPSPEELKAIIADARQRATSYVDTLPNFMCVEATTRSVDLSGSGRWKPKDSLLELLSYRDKSESRTLIEVDGKPTAKDSLGLKGTRSVGEFGGVLNSVFQASSKADLKWKQTARLGSGTVEVFEYRVAREDSSFKVTGAGNDQITVGFHGQVFIYSATRSVRRITLIADDLPRAFSIHATSIGVDYDYISLNAHDYLMPVSAQISLREGRHAATLNLIEFRDYRRFGSNARILGFAPVDKP